MDLSKVRRYGKYGPLSLMKAKGSELVAGDVFCHGKEMAVVLRSYPLDHMKKQNLTLEVGDPEVSPLHAMVSSTEDFIIYRAEGKDD
jgi:hypothetical protein